MKEVVIDWTNTSTLPKLPDSCLVCQKPSEGYSFSPEYNWLNARLPYCKDHIEKAKLSHAFFRKYMEKDGAVIQVANILGWIGALTVLVLLVWDGTNRGLDWFDWLLALLAAGITKLIITQGLAILYTFTYIRSQAKKQGLTLDEVKSRFLGLNLTTAQAANGIICKLEFVNDEVGNKFAEELGLLTNEAAGDLKP